MITEAQLKGVMSNLPAPKLAQLLPFLNDALQAHAIDNLLRTAAFVAQLAHESGEFRFMEEIWGPIPAQLRYEPQTDLSKKLGNTQPGDGKRFKGRGPIQITGRFNYQKYGDLLKIDLIAAPEKAAAPEVAFMTAGLFWRSNGLNELADAEQFVTITKRINGGTNGLEDRQMYYAKAKAVLAQGFQPNPTTRGARSPAAPLEPLTRGFEAIAEETGEADAIPAKKAAARAPTKKVPARKAAAKKAGAEKAAAKKAVAKRAAASESAGKKAPAKKKTG